MYTPPPEPKNPVIPNYHFDNLKQIETGYWWYEGRLIWAKTLIQDWVTSEKIRPENILYADLGCGTGGFGNAISKNFQPKTTHLVDSNSDALDKIERAQGTTILKLDLEKEFSLPFKPNLVTCMDVIEHLKDDSSVLERIVSQMAAGGLLLISVPAHSILYSQWDKSLGHYRRFSSRNLKQKITKAGLEIRRMHHAWSFLFLPAFYRHLTPSKQSKLQYPKVSPRFNKFLIQAARLESSLSSKISIPFGTSLFLTAVKP